MKDRIPKVIHYCWFGGKPLPEDAKKCIASWRKYCPDYEIIEWNESNYDINKTRFTSFAYDNKKWAFLSDYARLDIVYNEGGIYLDTDVELVKSLDPLLSLKGYFGMEEAGRVATGLGFGAQKHSEILRDLMALYNKEPLFVKNNKIFGMTCVDIATGYFKNNGLTEKNSKQLIGGVVVYPTDYFCPIKIGTRKIRLTKNTYSIHHYEASWKSDKKVIRAIKYRLIPIKKTIKKTIDKVYRND